MSMLEIYLSYFRFAYGPAINSVIYASPTRLRLPTPACEPPDISVLFLARGGEGVRVPDPQLLASFQPLDYLLYALISTWFEV